MQNGEGFFGFITPLAEACAAITELLGILIITVLAAYSLIYAAVQLTKKVDAQEVFHRVRQRLGRGILLGLEFLVGADIIHTVAVDLSFETVGVLAVIVVIRTFLSFALDLELTGKWPWQKARTPAKS